MIVYREICYEVVWNNANVIGGEGKIVQIDLSHIYTKKSHRGHFLRNEENRSGYLVEFRKTMITLLLQQFK